MGKLILEVQTSADGFVADDSGRTDWMVWNWGEDWTWDADLQTYHNDLHDAADAILLSRKMAEEGFIEHWQAIADMPENSQSGFARKITETPKFVFSTKLTRSIWANTILVLGNIIEEISKIKCMTANTILAYGGASFAASLIESGLVDEIHLFINPVALGTGLPLFRQRANLSLIGSTCYGFGMIVSKYRVNTNL